MVRSNVRLAPLLAAVLLLSCRAQNESDQNDFTSIEPDRPALPVIEPALDREGLLIAVARAASAAALSSNDREAQRELDGDRFELRIRFGCGGPRAAADSGPRSWTFDEKERVIRFRLEPDFAGDLPMMEAMAGGEFESVEGFWIRRPWLLSAGCAPTLDGPPPATTAPPADERVGIAQFFTEADPRTHRRDSRAYEATKRLEEKEAPSSHGYDLVLSGRLKALPDGRVIACAAAQAEAPPECIVSAGFDRVRIERPDTRAVVAEWDGA